MSIEDIIRRLREDRQIAERERLQAQIEAAFAAARTVERRRFGRPMDTNPTLYGRRKDDAPQVVDAVVKRFKQMITDASDPGVELVEPEPLAQQAAPLLASIGSVPVFRKKDVKCFEINEVFQGYVMKLFAEAEAALDFKKAERKIDMLKFNIKTEKPPIWKRDILGRK
jgi:hypothetical protein